MRVVSVSVTEAGRALAARLPYERVHGSAADAIRRLWDDVDALVVFLATGATVRIVAPLLMNKSTDPAIVCVDETARFAIALCGGHAGGANALANDVAAMLGAEPVVTTATESAGIASLDALPGFVADGDVAGVTTSLLDGGRCALEVDPALADWPLPAALTALAGSGRAGARTVAITDRAAGPREGAVNLRPPSLVIGVGCSSDAAPSDVAALVDDVLARNGLASASVAAVATIDRRLDHPAIRALNHPVRAYTSEELSAVVGVPSPSDAVRSAVGTPSVAEAAAMLAAGPDGSLAVAKAKSARATVAIARRRRPKGHLDLVGLGPGGSPHRTPAATGAVRNAEVVIGYTPYVDQAADLFTPAQEIIRSPIGDEVVRAKQALAEASAGRRVAVVCSGDAGVYAMASIVLELAGELAPDVDVEVLPGVTAALAASAVLGAPLGHDHVILSLSDLLTPWEAIERRLRAAAEADLVVALYNPRSNGRSWQLDAAVEILHSARPDSTPVGVVTDAARVAQRTLLTSLGEIDTSLVDMTTCVIVGSSSTKIVAGRMVTPRGYVP